MIESLTHERFEAYLDDEFVIVQGAGRISCRLTECSELRDGGPVEEGRRRPFSLIFVGPVEPVLHQATYRVEHAKLGALDLFLVPVGRSEAGAQYQAVFA